MATDHLEEARHVLRAKGFRATLGRARLLAVLDKAATPLSLSELEQLVPVDLATLYRTLPELVDAGILSRSELGNGVTHYEYSPHLPHHHHVVCAECGKVEDLTFCPVVELKASVTKKTEGFAHVYSHNLEFSGLCISCL